MNATHTHVAVVASRTLSSFRVSCLDLFRCARIALLAVERSAERGRPPLGGGDPRPIHPRWVVTYVLLVAALEFCDPVALVVLVVSGDAPVHERIVIDDAAGSTGAQPGPVSSLGVRSPPSLGFRSSCLGHPWNCRSASLLPGQMAEAEA